MDEFIVIIEGSSDAPTATELAERIFVERVDWLEPPHLSGMFAWSGLQQGTNRSYWQNLKKDAADLGLRIPAFRSQSHWGGQKPDQKMARKVLYLVGKLRKQRPIRAVLLIRDMDNQPERRQGLERARTDYEDSSLEIVIGTADRNREAWVLNGFVSRNQQEEAILSDYQKQLKFDPCLEAERLRATSRNVPERVRNVKVVVEELTGGDPEREAMCWQETDLNVLRERGGKTGLTAYMNEVEQRLVPIFTSQ